MPTMTGTTNEYIKIDSTSDVTTTAGSTRERILLVGFCLVAGGTVSLTFKTGSTAMTGAMPLIANTGITAALDSGLLCTAAGESLVLGFSGAVQVSGYLTIRRIGT